MQVMEVNQVHVSNVRFGADYGQCDIFVLNRKMTINTIISQVLSLALEC